MAVLLSLGPIPSGRLKNLKDVDKWSSLSLYLTVRGECQSLESLSCTCTVRVGHIESFESCSTWRYCDEYKE